MTPTRIPGIEYAAMPRAGSKASALAWPPRLAVVHDTGNSNSTRYNEASFAATRTDAQSQWTSAHGYIDRGGILGSLPLNLQAWAAMGYANAHGVHVEICLRDLHDPDAMRHAAWFIRWVCQAAGIPMRRLTPAQVAAGERGVCGHYDITLAHIDKNDHQDPSWSPQEWTTFMTMVTSGGGDDMTPDEHNLLYNIDAWLRQLVGVHAGPVPIIPVAANPAGTVAWPNKAVDATAAINAKLDAVLKAQGVAQADIDELQARPTVDLPALAAALTELLAPLLDGKLDAGAVLAVLQSPEGQAALAQAANTAEDS